MDKERIKVLYVKIAIPLETMWTSHLRTFHHIVSKCESLEVFIVVQGEF